MEKKYVLAFIAVAIVSILLINAQQNQSAKAPLPTFKNAPEDTTEIGTTRLIAQIISFHSEHGKTDAKIQLAGKILTLPVSPNVDIRVYPREPHGSPQTRKEGALYAEKIPLASFVEWSRNGNPTDPSLYRFTTKNGIIMGIEELAIP